MVGLESPNGVKPTKLVIERMSDNTHAADHLGDLQCDSQNELEQ